MMGSVTTVKTIIGTLISNSLTVRQKSMPTYRLAFGDASGEVAMMRSEMIKSGLRPRFSLSRADDDENMGSTINPDASSLSVNPNISYRSSSTNSTTGLFISQKPPGRRPRIQRALRGENPREELHAGHQWDYASVHRRQSLS